MSPFEWVNSGLMRTVRRMLCEKDALSAKKRMLGKGRVESNYSIKVVTAGT